VKKREAFAKAEKGRREWFVTVVREVKVSSSFVNLVHPVRIASDHALPSSMEGMEARGGLSVSPCVRVPVLLSLFIMTSFTLSCFCYTDYVIVVSRPH
jgi:hypothetical protein